MAHKMRTRRRARREKSPLLRLPTDLLRKIASHTVSPAVVVAVGKFAPERAALRKGTDEAERSRFGGIGMTVREAEHELRTRYRHILDESSLASREAAGRAFSRRNIVRTDERHPDAPANRDDWVLDGEYDPRRVFVPFRFMRTLIAYGAKLSRECIPLHYVAGCPSAGSVDVARLLLAAGADIDAECEPDDGAGTCALAWCIEARPARAAKYELALFLIEEGCDVVKADAGYLVASGADLLRNLEDEPLTPANQRLIDLIKSALNVEESTYEAAFEVAQQRLDAHRDAFYARMNAYTRHIPWY